MFGLEWFGFRAPAANHPVLSHRYDGAITGGVDVDDGDAVTQRLRGGRQGERHLLSASCSVLLGLVSLQHVCAELPLDHISWC